MNESIVVMLNPTELKQTVYIMSANTETVPIILQCPQEELLSTVAMSAAKYQITDIKLKGATDYAVGIQEQLQNKINTCFGKSNNFTIELM